MANTAIDVNRLTSGVLLNPEQSTEIWTGADKQSAITQLATRVNLPGRGVEWQELVDDVAAEWVDETGEKPVNNPTFSHKIMKPRKLARIITVSEEFTRDEAALWNAVQAEAAKAIAKAIDQTFLTGAQDRPITEGMDTLADAEAVSVGGGKYEDFVKIATTVMENDGDLNGIALSPKGLAKFVSAVDGQKRPLFVPNPGDAVNLGSIFGAQVIKSPWGYKAATTGESATPAVYGVAGDWTQAYLGTVEGIKIKMSDSATVKAGSTTINLWQRNMIGFLVEVEVGFIVRNKAKFVRITD